MGSINKLMKVSKKNFFSLKSVKGQILSSCECEGKMEANSLSENLQDASDVFSAPL